MYEKLLALLIAKFAQARKDGLQQMARSLTLHVADETEAQALVDKIQESQVTTFIKDWRKDVDSEVSKGTKSFEDNLKSKYDLVEKKTPTSKTEQSDDIATIVAQAVASAIAPLQQKIQSFESGRTVENRREVLTGKLEGYPEVFKKTVLKNFDRMKFENDDEFATFITETETDGKTVEQELANTGLKGFPIPQHSANVKTAAAVASDITDWAKSNKKES